VKKTLAIAAGVTVVVIAGLTACGGGSNQPASQNPTPVSATSSATPAETTEPPTTTEPTEEVEPTGTTEPPIVKVMMPKAVGMSLQDAQDLMQKVTGNPLYVSTSTDLRFTRLQVLDSNWKVCRQKPKKGTKFDPETTTVEFGVVKLDESCP
jgi:hypothetical protein